MAAEAVESILRGEDHWAVLGLARERTAAAAVRHAFRRRALLVHPDKCSHANAERAFRALADAYEALAEPAAQARALARADGVVGAARHDTKRQRRGASPGREKPSRWRSWAEWERHLERREQLERDFKTAQSRRYIERAAERTLGRAERCVAELDERAGIADNPLTAFAGRVGAAGGGSSDGGTWGHDGFAELYPELHAEASRAEAAPPPASGAERLLELLLYLRETHCYCLFCASRYDSAEELESVCPGLLELAHEDCADDFD